MFSTTHALPQTSTEVVLCKATFWDGACLQFGHSASSLLVQTSTEVFFRKAKFWDGAGKDAPPAIHVDGVQYLHVKVGCGACVCI